MTLPAINTELPVLGIRHYPIVPLEALSEGYVYPNTFDRVQLLAHPTLVRVRGHAPDGFHVLATPRDYDPGLLLIIHHRQLQSHENPA